MGRFRIVVLIQKRACHGENGQNEIGEGLKLEQPPEAGKIIQQFHENVPDSRPNTI